MNTGPVYHGQTRQIILTPEQTRLARLEQMVSDLAYLVELRPEHERPTNFQQRWNRLNERLMEVERESRT